MIHALGCVSFLNSKPLIDPLVGDPRVRIHFAVPAELLPLVEAGTVSSALMSVVDFQTSKVPLLFVPSGMIGSDGPTLTVRLFSRVPAEKVTQLHADTDSHTSVILGRVLLKEMHGVTPAVIPLATARAARADTPEAMLLIGDKVVNAAPDASAYPHQYDLGEEWKRLTGLPFVFAMWMIRRDRAADEGAAIAALLVEARQRGAATTERLLDRYAEETRWPRDLARRYFTQYLRYEVTPAARLGLARFFTLAQRHGLLPAARAVEYLEPTP